MPRHTLPRQTLPRQTLRRQTLRRQTLRRLLAPALAAVALTACGSSGPAPGLQGAVFTTPYAKPAVTLTATDGQPYDLRARTAGKTTLLYFGYTHCPDVCPTVMADAAAALRHVPEAVRADTEVLFVTSDPERDTVPVLKDYLAHFDAGFVGLTGTQQQVTAFAQQLDEELELPTVRDGNYQVGHGAQLFGFAPGGTAPVAWLPGDSNQLLTQLEHDLPMLAAGRTT